MTLTRWNPVRDLAAIEIERLNRMFDAFTNEPFTGGTWVPAVDIFETADKDIVVKAELPEMKREDIKVTFENNVLSIEGDRQFTRDLPREQFHRVERGHGSFRRSFTLPSNIDPARVSASYLDGVLTVTLPRREEARPRQIEING
jgi:HSP20 family protein